jgi:hypothetical protein
MKKTTKPATEAAVVRGIAAAAVLVPLAALAGAMTLNHNETFLRNA